MFVRDVKHIGSELVRLGSGWKRNEVISTQETLDQLKSVYVAL
jgi:hypothetical protein